MRYRLLGLLLLALPLARAHAEDAPIEKWDQLYVAGAHSGWVHTVTKRVEENGTPTIVTTVVTDLKLNRLGATTHIHSKSETFEAPDGTLLRIVAEAKQSAQVSTSTFTFKDGKVTLETTVMGNTRTVEQDVDRDLVGPAFAAEALKQLAGTKDKKLEIKTYIADFQRVVVATHTSRGLEVTKLQDGTTAELTRVDSALEGIPGMRPVTWLDKFGETVKTALKMVGLQFDTYRVPSKADAIVDESKKTTAPDVFAQTMLTEADPIPVPRHLEQATIAVRQRDPAVPLPTFEAAGIDTKPGKQGELLLTARRVVPAKDKQGVRPLVEVPDAVRDALAPSSMIQCDAEAMVKTARDVVGDETNAWVAAQKLERWVFVNMTKKGMGVGFATARETLETREGDCSEHAVLLAALCRAAGIPSRVVMGLEYLFGVWAGHAWNDVWIDGAWYQLDATNGYGFVDPLHLPMAQMVLKEGGASEFIAILGSLDNLDLDIRSVVRDGRTIDVSKAASLVTAKDGRYVDPIWNIRFDVPSGFVFDAPKRGKRMSSKLMELDGKTAENEIVEIRIDAMDAMPGNDLTPILGSMKVDPKSVEERTVDGRPSHVVTTTQNGRRIIRTFVSTGGALFIFTLDRAGAEPERAAYAAFLASVDFD